MSATAMNQMQNAQWVFGKKKDLLVFGIPILLAIATTPLMNLGVIDYLILYILIDQSHIYTTFFYTYNSKRFIQEHKKLLILTPVISCLVTLGALFYIDYQATALILGLYSVYHFAKQQVAWFMIASSKEQFIKSKFEAIIDKLTIYLSVAGPAIIALSPNIGRSGWREDNDLPVLPDSVAYAVFIFWCLAIFLYIGLQIKKYKKENYISWGKHFHLVNGLIIWIMYRVNPFESIAALGALLIMYGHSVPYIYLGQRYMKDRVQKGESYYFPLPSLNYIFVVLTLFGILLAYSEVEFARYFWKESPFFVRSAILTCVFTHYFFDGFLWRKKYHPEGLAFLNQA